MKEINVRVVFISLWVVAAALLLVMFSQSAGEGGSPKVHSISVLMRAPGERFMKGMEQAALDFNADLHILSGYAKNDGATQLEYLQREINFTDAVVLNPENIVEMDSYLSGLRQSPPVVTVIQPIAAVKRHVGADDEALGKALGAWAAAEGEKSCLILCPVDWKPIHMKRRDALEATLKESGVESSIRYCENTQGSVSAAISSDRKRLILAIDDALLVNMCEQSDEDCILYGIGYSSGARQYLESGRLRGLAVYSEYDAGYLSLRAAVNAAEKKPFQEEALGIYKADAGNMYSEPIINILFPIG
ncbi:MAG: substrate-binding domain-containing protein [Clostridiales bacterium]|jgi:ribose transport system substrate-binding protein|nr:substrate-binding domain-containing protein [Clostridiales bacterium]